MCVRLFVCVYTVCERISETALHVHFSSDFCCVLLAAVARSSSGMQRCDMSRTFGFWRMGSRLPTEKSSQGGQLLRVTHQWAAQF